MKLGKLLIVASLLIGSTAFAQDSEGEDRECTRRKVVANNAMASKNWVEAVQYFILAEDYCAEFGKDNYDRLIACTQQVMDANERGSDVYYNYLDTLLMFYDVMDDKGFYNENDDIIRGYYETQTKSPDYKKADKFLSRGMKNQGMELSDPQFITLYYFNTYTMWYIEQDAEAKGKLKQRLIKDYFAMSKLIKEANYAPSIQEGLTGYLAQVITSCEDLTPEIPTFIESLPEDAESKTSALLNMADLMESKECDESEEYKEIIEMLYKLNPTDPDVQTKYVGTLPLSKRIPIYEEIKSNTTDEAKQNELQYKIAYTSLKLGSYNSAYRSAQSVSGEYRGEAYQIMATCVAKLANGCGDSTFERKSNYLYAAQLLEKAQANGVGGLSGTIANYKAAGPDKNDCFDNGNPSSITLTCWGVSVNPCP